MVAGLAVGKRVKALAKKVKQHGWCKGKWPGTWATEWLTGNVVEKVGRTWRVQWDDEEAGQSTIPAQRLENADLAPIPAVGVAVDNAAVAVNNAAAAPADAAAAAGVVEEDDAVDINLQVADAFDEAEAEAAAVPGDELLQPHGLQWTVQPDGVPMQRPNVSTARAELIWPDNNNNNNRTPVEYFYLFFPMSIVAATLVLTNTRLNSAGRSLLTEQEFFVYIGLMLSCTLYKSHSLEVLFRGHGDGFSIDVSPMLQKYMSLSRFQYITRFLQFATPPTDAADRAAKGDFWAIQPLIDAFNARRTAVFRAGAKVVVDESFCPWCGKDSRHVEHGCPHVQKEARKPKGVGMELKNVACVMTGIMMAIEIVASADEMHHRQHWVAGFAATALLLRLLASLSGSGRIVLGDSAFASVQTAVTMFNTLGLFFIGCVKSCTKQYPFKYTQEFDYAQRGDHVALTAEVDGVDLLAVGWGDKNVKSFIATCGTTVAGAPHDKKRWRNLNNGTTEYFTFPVPRPKVCGDYYNGAQIIDVHNHERQDFVGLEMRATNSWSYRFFQTFIGIIEVDAHKAYKYFDMDGPDTDTGFFLRSVAVGLLDNKRGDATEPLRARQADVEPDAASTQQHVLGSLAQTPYYQRKKRDAEERDAKPGQASMRCRLCRTRTSYYCKTCSDDTIENKTKGLHAYCGSSPRHNRSCFADHVRDASDDDDSE
jgi:hypothetical protein